MIRHRLACLCLAMICLAWPAAATEAETVAPAPLVMAHIFPPGMVQHRAMAMAAEELARRSDGRMRIEIAGDGRIGNQDSRLIEAISVGLADMTLVTGAVAARDYGPIGLISGPFNFRDFSHWKHFRDSPLARELIDAYEASSGLVVLGLCYYGPRHIAARRPIRTPDDLAGLRIRVPNAPGYLRLFRGFGASPTSIPFSEIRTQLDAGMVDAEESPLSTMLQMKFYEILPDVALTGHSVETALVVIGRRSLERYPPADQALLRDVFTAAASRLSEGIAAEEVGMASRLTEQGARVASVNRTAFLAKIRPLLEGDAFPWSGTLYARLQAIR